MRAMILIALAVLPTGSSGADVTPQTRGHCFVASQFIGWRAGDDMTIYLRANVNRYYRLDLMRACGTLDLRDPRLILRARAGSTICSALDVDLRVSDAFQGPAEPCPAKSITGLTPEQVAALPPKSRP
jgi:Family of unknown function (DUF6491)